MYISNVKYTLKAIYFTVDPFGSNSHSVKSLAIRELISATFHFAKFFVKISCAKGVPRRNERKNKRNWVFQWCIHKKCVPMGTRPAAVHGGWGKWGPMSSCSRTCGGGLRHAERECDNPPPANNGRYCIGERKKFTLCNTMVNSTVFL